MNTQRKVTKLMDNICKIRDILDKGDFNELKKSLFVLEKLKNDIIRQCKKYIESESHQLDFTYEDVRELADELMDFENKVIKIRYSQLEKRLFKNTPVEIKHYNQLCYEVHDRLYFDRFIRPIANELSFFALTTFLWSQTEYRKPFMEQIAEHIKSFV